MKRTTNFRFKIGERNLENYALPPEDPIILKKRSRVSPPPTPATNPA